jgi:hypothetical protein
MSDETNTTPTPAAWEESVKQLKGELNRKTKETSELVNQLLNSQAQIQQAIAQMAKPSKKDESKDEVNLTTLMYDDPKRYSQVIKEQAKQEALEEMRRETSSQTSVNQAIAQLAADYPELADQESELTKASVEILKSAGESERANPRTYEYAVLKAAGALDIKPRSKRTQSEDDFVAPSYSSPQGRTKKRNDDSVVSENKILAAQFGIDLDNPALKAQYIELTKRNKR